MAGLVPALHVFPAGGDEDVDAPDKPGHDGFGGQVTSAAPSAINVA